jgi:pimeloyl-ACP methyl ester carboxylesterase
VKIHGTSLVALAGLVILVGCDSTKRDRAPAGLYKNAEGKAAAFASYDRAMGLWPVEWEEDWVETEHGITHVVVSGPPGAKPVFLIPGLFADATMWYPNVGALAEQYRVYSLDLTTFGGKSEPSAKPVADITDYVGWFKALLSHYGHSTVAVAGLSYGSWLSLALAREIPESVAAVIMLDPSETFIKMDGGIAWKGFWSFAVFPNRAKYARFFDWLGGGYTDSRVETWFEHMLDVIEHGSVGMFDVPQHRIYGPEELTMVTMPVLVMAGGKPILYKDPQRLAAAAALALPGAEIEIVPGTGHSLNAEKADQVNTRMTRFLSENYK